MRGFILRWLFPRKNILAELESLRSLIDIVDALAEDAGYVLVWDVESGFDLRRKSSKKRSGK